MNAPTLHITRSSIAGGICLGMMAFVAGCSQMAPEAKEAPPMPVKVGQPIQKQVTEYADLTGRTAAVESVEIRARVWGYIDKVNFKEGMLVKKGDVLFEIDPRSYKAALNLAEGHLGSAEAKVARLDLDFKRAAALVNSKGISREDYDKTLGDRAEAIAAKAALVGAVEQAKLDLYFTKVIAPVSGRVGRALVTEGNLVQSGQTGGTVLTTLVSVDPIYAYFDVDERSVLRVRQLIREGKFKSAREETWPVFLGLANENNYPHEGKIDFVDNQINPKVGTLRLRGVFPNKDEWLSPGYFVRVRMPIGRPHEAVLISDRVIDTDQGQKIVYVADADNKVAIRHIRLGPLHDGMRAVDEGLSPTDKVILTGLQHLRPGMTVEPTLEPMPKPRP